MYSVFVTSITTRPHPNADRLLLGTCKGYQVVVGKETKDGDLGLLFPCDGQLSEEFAKANDLIRRKLPDGTPAGGMFDENRRVRAQTFRGEKSDGFWIPLSSLTFTGTNLSKFTNGVELGRDAMEITTVNGTPIAQKYETPATRSSCAKSSVKSPTMFIKHVDTEQLRDYIDDIPIGSCLIVTEKMHGTSHRLGLVLDDTKKANLFSRILARLGFIRLPRWSYASGTRNTVVGVFPQNKDFYGGDGFRETAISSLRGNLRRGEIVFGEIVGYTEAGACIMNPHDTTKLSDKAFIKQYGPQMVYDYGRAEKTCKFYVYRIVLVNEDGFVVEYNWNKVKERCAELGVETVKEMIPSLVYDGNKEKLLNTLAGLVEGESLFDSGHIREGVVVRVDSAPSFTTYKYKSHTFGVLEGYLKDTNVVDIEEAS